jgi:phasin family protein
MLNVEQLTAAQKTNAETLFGLTTKVFAGAEKLVELNLQVAKTALGDLAENTNAALAAKDVQGLLALQAGLLQPAAEKAAAYGRHVYDIVASTGAEVRKVAEEEVAKAQGKFASFVDTAVKNAPAGSDNAVTLVRSAMAAANNVYETAQKAAQQAADVAEANIQAITNNAVKSVKAKRAAS